MKELHLPMSKELPANLYLGHILSSPHQTRHGELLSLITQVGHGCAHAMIANIILFRGINQPILTHLEGKKVTRRGRKEVSTLAPWLLCYLYATRYPFDTDCKLVEVVERAHASYRSNPELPVSSRMCHTGLTDTDLLYPAMNALNLWFLCARSCSSEEAIVDCIVQCCKRDRVAIIWWETYPNCYKISHFTCICTDEDCGLFHMDSLKGFVYTTTEPVDLASHLAGIQEQISLQIHIFAAPVAEKDEQGHIDDDDDDDEPSQAKRLKAA